MPYALSLNPKPYQSALSRYPIFNFGPRTKPEQVYSLQNESVSSKWPSSAKTCMTLVTISTVLGSVTIATGLFQYWNYITDGNQCKNQPCFNGGICENTVEGFICLCPYGFIGHDCSTKSVCGMLEPCVSGGTCEDHQDPTQFVCYCPSGFTGQLCDRNIDDCASQPCQNNGLCRDDTNGFTCQCDAFFTGQLCETDVDDCRPDPCRNGATCTDYESGYICQCADGFRGDKCEIGTCDSHQCQNVAECREAIGAYQCHCTYPFYGPKCQYSANDCYSSNPCYNGGTCNNLQPGYECKCADYFTGTNCEQAMRIDLAHIPETTCSESSFEDPYSCRLTLDNTLGPTRADDWVVVDGASSPARITVVLPETAILDLVMIYPRCRLVGQVSKYTIILSNGYRQEVNRFCNGNFPPDDCTGIGFEEIYLPEPQLINWFTVEMAHSDKCRSAPVDQLGLKEIQLFGRFVSEI